MGHESGSRQDKTNLGNRSEEVQRPHLELKFYIMTIFGEISRDCNSIWRKILMTQTANLLYEPYCTSCELSIPKWTLFASQKAGEKKECVMPGA